MKTITLMPLACCLFLIVILVAVGTLFLPLLLGLLPVFLILLLCRWLFGPRVIAIHRFPPPPSGPGCERAETAGTADTSGEAADTVIDVTAQVVDESPDTIRKIGE